MMVLEEQPSQAACITVDYMEKRNASIKQQYELSLNESLDGEKMTAAKQKQVKR